jgi:hypothetical protein
MLCYGAMDNFTLAVVVSDILMVMAMFALILLDKKGPAEPEKATGKRPA